MAAAPVPVEMLCSTTGKANVQRVARLLISRGTTLLRDIFDIQCPPCDLPKRLKNPATESKLKAAKLTKPQWDCLYPSPGVYGKSEDFDVTLILRLLGTICNLFPPVTGWDAQPTSTDHSLAADLARMKYYRNTVYGHVNQNMEIADVEFLSLWQEISEALIRIARQVSHEKELEWRKAIGSLYWDSLTAEDERHVEELLMWYEHDRDVKKCIEELNPSTTEAQEGIERLETSVQERLEGASNLLEKEFQEGIERLETNVQGRLAGTEPVLRTSIREEAQNIKDKLGEVNQSIERLNASAGGPQGAKGQLKWIF